MTLSGWIAIAAVAAVCLALIYLLLLVRLKALLAERQLKIADQLGTLDEAIRALETRLSAHPVQASVIASSEAEANAESAGAAGKAGSEENEESGEIAPEIQAAIAAATVAALGPDAVVQSVKPAASPWSQQGRVMVQGGHNFRVRR